MATSSRGPAAASFLTQANALLRKNLTFQKRNLKTNIVILSFPILFCVLIVVIQSIVNHAVKSVDHNQCVCKCVDTNGDGKCETVCSSNDLMDSFTCPVPSPPRWPPLLQVPLPEYRAVRADFIPFTDLPDDSCRKTQTCPATLLFTGGDPSFAKNLARNFFVSSLSSNVSDYVDELPNFVMGTDSDTGSTQFTEPAFSSLRPLYVLQPKCLPNFTLPLQMASKTLQKEVKCVEGLSLWRDSASLINDELYKGYQQGNVKKETNQIAAAYDFLTSNEKHFMVNIWYNASYKEGTSGGF